MLENTRVRVGREVVSAFAERIQEPLLREVAEELLGSWGEELREAFWHARHSFSPGVGTRRLYVQEQLLITILVGLVHTGWCLSEEVVKRLFRKWQRLHGRSLSQ